MRRNLFFIYVLFIALGTTFVFWFFLSNRGMMENPPSDSTTSSRTAQALRQGVEDGRILIEAWRQGEIPEKGLSYEIPIAWFRGNLVGVSKVEWESLDLRYQTMSINREWTRKLSVAIMKAQEKVTDPVRVRFLWDDGTRRTKVVQKQFLHKLLERGMPLSSRRHYTARRIHLAITPGQNSKAARAWPIGRINLSKASKKTGLSVTDTNTIRSLQRRLDGPGIFSNSGETWWVVPTVRPHRLTNHQKDR